MHWYSFHFVRRGRPPALVHPPSTRTLSPAPQVHWYSFQFAMDELVDELEEAFLAVSVVLNQLPFPIR